VHPNAVQLTIEQFLQKLKELSKKYLLKLHKYRVLYLVISLVKRFYEFLTLLANFWEETY